MNSTIHNTANHDSGAPNGKRGHVKITVMDYDATHFEEKTVHTAAECLPYKDKQTVTWINVEGAGDGALVQQIGDAFGLHPLTIQDVMARTRRPKLEDFDGYLFVVLNMLTLGEHRSRVISERVALVLGANYLISFQEGLRGDVFEDVRQGIRQGKGHVRQMGCDHLIYSLIDAMVDSYFKILDKQWDRIEVVEEELVANPTRKALHDTHELRQQLVILRKGVWPLRETINGLQRLESPLVSDSTRVYLRNLYDHTVEVIETVETFRDMVSGMLDIYLSSMSYRLNEVMKVLTIIATIFIPLTFFAGVYGMNFKHMPELEWRYGYPAALGGMALVALGMLVYFRKKKWL